MLQLSFIRLSLMLAAVFALSLASHAQQPWPADTANDPYAAAYPQPLPVWNEPAHPSGAYPGADNQLAYPVRNYSAPIGGPYPAANDPYPVDGNVYPAVGDRYSAMPTSYPGQPLAGPAYNPAPAPPQSAGMNTSIQTESIPPPEQIASPEPEQEVIGEEIVVEAIVIPAVKWEHSFEFGMNGSEGNTETFNVRFGYDGSRKSKSEETTWSSDYKFEENAGTTTVDELHFEGRHEWLYQDSPWSTYVHSTYDFDQFTAYDSRFALDAGVGYQFVRNDINKLKGRFGSGASKEFGSTDDDWKPELVFGLEYERKLSDRQKLALSCEYYPEVGDFMDSWTVTKADWEVLIDEAWNMSLKIGIRNRYDSTPSGSKHNDLDYSTVLLWKF